MSAITISVLLSREEVLSREQIKALQGALHDNGQTQNSEKYGEPDGILGPKTRADIIGFITNNPEILATMSLSMKKELIHHGFTSDLAGIVSGDEGLQEQLISQTEDILNGQALDELSKSELMSVQANWSLLGLYPAHLKIDGLIGPGSIAAFEAHKGKISPPSVTENPVREATQESESEQAFSVTDNTEKREVGSFVSEKLQQAAWTAIETTSLSEIPKKEGPSNGRTLRVIDLGHGEDGYRGAHSPHNSLREADAIDAAAIAIADEVIANGGDVAFTRGSGEHYRYGEKAIIGPNNLSSLESRAAWAITLKRLGGYEKVEFISMHANSHTSSELNGAFVYAGVKGNNNGKVDFGGDAQDPKSLQFSQIIANNMTLGGKDARTGTGDFTTTDYFDAHKDPEDSGILFELPFLSNERDVGLIAAEAIMNKPTLDNTRVAFTDDSSATTTTISIAP